MPRPRLPYMPFFPSSWMSDNGLRACGVDARGLWIDMLCLMWDSPRRGFLLNPDESVMDAVALARRTSVHRDHVARLLKELETNKVCDVVMGAYVSRRMVREEAKRDSGRSRQASYLERHNERHNERQNGGSSNGDIVRVQSIYSSPSGEEKSASAVMTLPEANTIPEAVVFFRGINARCQSVPEMILTNALSSVGAKARSDALNAMMRHYAGEQAMNRPPQQILDAYLARAVEKLGSHGAKSGFVDGKAMADAMAKKEASS